VIIVVEYLKRFWVCVLPILGLFNHIEEVAAAINPYNTPGKEVYDIEADYVFHDQQKDMVYASGNVVVNHVKQMLVADYAIYFRSAQEVYAKGNVSLRREDGSVYFGDVMRLSKLWHQGTIANFRGRFGSNSNIAAKVAEMIDEDKTALHGMVYSPCKLCSDNFVSNVPLWQVRSTSSTLSKKDEVIKHRNAIVEAFGIPVLYAPYLSTPSPGAKRKSGFLFPSLFFSSLHGTQIYTPYYWNIAPNMDATLGAKIHNRKAHYNVYDVEWRYLDKQGYYTLKNSFNYGYKESRSGVQKRNKQVNSHYELEAVRRFIQNDDVTSLATVSSKAILGGNKNYLRRYHISDDLVLNSDTHIRYFDSNRYYAVRSLYFQDLRPGAHQKTTALLIPGATYIHDNLFTHLPFNTSMNLHYSNIYRPQGMGYQRVIGMATATKRLVMSSGMIIDGKVLMRGDVYHAHLNQVQVATNYKWNHQSKLGTFTRYHPQLDLMLHLPLYNQFSGSGIIIDPIIQLIASPYQKKSLQMENEDSQIPTISGYNLFSDNRYHGYDLLEGGNRINYGLVLGMVSPKFKNLSLTVGQSYKPKREKFLDKFSGMESRFSDYVVEITAQPLKGLNINQSMRVDHSKFALNLNEIAVNYAHKGKRLSLSYFSLGNEVLKHSPNKQRSKREIIMTPGYNFYRQWWLDVGVHTRLGKKPAGVRHNIITNSITLKNHNECLQTEFTITRDYTKITRNKAETTYLIKIRVPTF
jgi:LPS-assembly protein